MRNYNITNPAVLDELEKISVEINAKREEIVHSIALLANEKENYDVHGIVTDEELFNIRLEFVDLAVKTFYGVESKLLLEEWANKLGEYAIVRGATLPAILPVTNQYRRVIWELIEKMSEENGLLPETIFKSSLILNGIVDRAANTFSVAFVKHHEKKINETNDFIKEMSAPIVPISKGIAVLPLVGHLDEERSAVLMDTTVNQIVDHQLDVIFIDLSGVSVIDTYVARRLSDVMKLLKILGITPILSGLRPEMSQTIVSLGIDLKAFKVVSNLKQALIDYGVCKDIR
ncbi:STAS domain-containing protein [Salipaludibacillus sp. CF4.18]|uniref:STAS domain-containing protein n=1 Tax=Salipaludibacillus sp. CF4.18 TaxID=3373081 RepID=UPI003EE78081